VHIKLEGSNTPDDAVIRSCITLLLAGTCVASCGGAAVRRDPATTAAIAERTHCNGSAQDDPRIFTPDVAIGVAPVMKDQRLGKVDRQVLAGAELAIRAQPGLTSEWLDRSLICHQAHRVLGQVTAPEDDAYWLSGRWLDFAVRSRGDVFFVDIYAEDPEAANAVLERARAFVAHRGAAAGQSSL